MLTVVGWRSRYISHCLPVYCVLLCYFEDFSVSIEFDDTGVVVKIFPTLPFAGRICYIFLLHMLTYPKGNNRVVKKFRILFFNRFHNLEALVYFYHRVEGLNMSRAELGATVLKCI